VKETGEKKVDTTVKAKQEQTETYWKGSEVKRRGRVGGNGPSKFVWRKKGKKGKNERHRTKEKKVNRKTGQNALDYQAKRGKGGGGNGLQGRTIKKNRHVGEREMKQNFMGDLKGQQYAIGRRGSGTKTRQEQLKAKIPDGGKTKATHNRGQH